MSSKLTKKQEMFCKDIGNYILNTDGTVYSKRKNKFMVGSNNKSNGYNYVTINNKIVSRHRLIAKTFIGNNENKPCVNHIDGDKKNNSVSNLEWCTYEENMQHCVYTGNDGVSGFKNHGSKFNLNQLKKIKKMRSDGETYRSIAEKFYVSQSQIYNIVKGISYKGCV